MRKVFDEQMKLGEVDISKLVFDPKSRDEIPQLLCGLQYIYCNIEVKIRYLNYLRNISSVAKLVMRNGSMENISDGNSEIELQLEL